MKTANFKPTSAQCVPKDWENDPKNQLKNSVNEFKDSRHTQGKCCLSIRKAAANVCVAKSILFDAIGNDADVT